MKPIKKSSILKRFLTSEKQYPVLAGIASGLYPLLFYYSKNFTLIDSWIHFGYFVLCFLVIPVLLFLIFDKIHYIKQARNIKKYVLPFLSIFIFLFLIKLCLFPGTQKKIILGILILSSLYAYFLYNFYKKGIVLQLLLSTLAAFSLINSLSGYLNHSPDWKKPIDNIESVAFKKKPNIYFIQPDGYVNFSELSKGNYKIDNSSFEDSLANFGFKNYPKFRSNYPSTLYSNSATFMMKHHFYNNGTVFNEALAARDDIISDNTVLRVLKNNGYKTHFIAQSPYLMLNRPEMGFDYSNFKYDDFGFISNSFEGNEDVVNSFSKVLNEKSTNPSFYFIEFFKPGHINGKKSESIGKIKEKEEWVKKLKKSNKILAQLIDLIKQNDENPLIIILADHGGFVGLDYTEEIYKKTQNKDLIHSMFSSQLSIHWPQKKAPNFDTKFKSSVNTFRIIFSYLSENELFLENLQEDSSYVLIREGAPDGVYKYINGKGEIVFEKLN